MYVVVLRFSHQDAWGLLFNLPPCLQGRALQTYHETKILHILLHDNIVKKDQMFSIKIDVMLPHHRRGEGVAAPEDWSGDRGVLVQLSDREELIEGRSPNLGTFSAKELQVTKVPIQSCDSKTIVNSPRRSSGIQHNSIHCLT